MRKIYRLTFEFCKNENQAQALCERLNKTSTYYIRKNKPAHYTPYNSNEYNFIVWYYI